MAKIDSQLNARLEALQPDQTLRTIVLLDTRAAGVSPGRRPSSEQRRAILAAMRRTVQPAMADLDRILERWGGRRLADQVDALGSVPVEATAAGTRALAASEHVRAILIDQVVSALPTPGSD